MHFAAARHVEGIGTLLGDVQGYILQQLPLQTVPEVPGGNELAFLAGKGGIVDGEGHFDGGIADLHKGQGFHSIGSAQGAADGDIRHAGQGHNFARLGLLDGVLTQAVELVQRHDLALGFDLRVMEVADGDLLIDPDGAPLHTAHGNTAHILIVVDGGHQQLQGAIFIALGGIDIPDDGLEQRGQVGAHLVGAVGSGALTAGAEDGGGIELLVGGVQIQQQLQNLIHNLVDTGVGLIHLVDGHDDLVAQLQGLLQHEPGLGHGAFGSIHQQDDAVDHLQNALHLAAEIGVARGIDDVDFIVFIANGGVLGKNGDAALPLQVAGVHHALHRCLIFPVDAALLQHFVHQGGLAVVNVGNDGNISDFILRCHIFDLLFCIRFFISQLVNIPHYQIYCNIFVKKYLKNF